MRPNLNAYHKGLLNAYYRARREGTAGEILSKSVILAELAQCDCESDIGLMILQRVDDHYLTLYAERLKRAQKS